MSVTKVVFHSVRQEVSEQEYLERQRHLAEYREGFVIMMVLIGLFGALSFLMTVVSWQGALLGVLYLLPSQ
jgi:cellobiose-specific phosphotransferase system component IIC